uniref:Uncharacterized protein n=1 Tax=Arundo donax TaxID=35708 RepID=A0A0A9ENH5_ARUDO
MDSNIRTASSRKLNLVYMEIKELLTSAIAFDPLWTTIL